MTLFRHIIREIKDFPLWIKLEVIKPIFDPEDYVQMKEFDYQMTLSTHQAILVYYFEKVLKKDAEIVEKLRLGILKFTDEEFIEWYDDNVMCYRKPYEEGISPMQYNFPDNFEEILTNKFIK
jgi:hypothetical protein